MEKEMSGRSKSAALLLLIISYTTLPIFSPSCQARTFKQALPGFKFDFPKDHASHEDFKTEWWYYTGHLLTEDKRPFGFELTFFRTGIDADTPDAKSAWTLNNIYLAHFALSDEKEKKFYYFEKLNRAGLSCAGAASDHFHVFNEGWSAELLGDTMVIQADSPKFRLHLMLDSSMPPVVHGKDGVSQKASCKGCASHYYSLTRLKTKGVLSEGGKCTNVTGLSWMDHEFGSNQLTKDQVGWDWFSLQLDDDSQLMLYVMRNTEGGIDENSSGTIIAKDGTSKHLNLSDFQIKSLRKWKSSASGGTYPLSWEIEIPSEKLKVKVEPTFDAQELVTKGSTGVTYWEGSATVKGTRRARPIGGRAYVEMTGYAEKFRKNI
jgi:predicted secreted hydrolase